MQPESPESIDSATTAHSIAMLAAQAALLDKLFTDAANKSLQAQDAKEARAFAAQALKAQSQCRQTILTIEKLQTLPPLHAGRKLDAVSAACVEKFVTDQICHHAAAIDEMYAPVFAYKHSDTQGTP